jgi:transmembrane sensor
MDRQNELLELAGKYFSGNYSEKEKDALFILRQEKDNEYIFKELEKIWETSGSCIRPFSPNVDNALIYVKERLSVPAPFRRSRRGYYIGAAALIVAGICTVGLLSFLKGENFKSLNLSKTIPAAAKMVMIEISTQDSAALFELPDGTKVLLSENSTLKYPQRIDSLEKNVYLEGKALFEVSGDSTRNFVVHTQYAYTSVTTATFSVSSHLDEREVEFEVVSGKVIFCRENDWQKVTLEQGQRLVLNKKNKSVILYKEGKVRAEKFWWKKLRKKVKTIFRKREMALSN